MKSFDNMTNSVGNMMKFIYDKYFIFPVLEDMDFIFINVKWWKGWNKLYEYGDKNLCEISYCGFCWYDISVVPVLYWSGWYRDNNQKWYILL